MNRLLFSIVAVAALFSAAFITPRSPRSTNLENNAIAIRAMIEKQDFTIDVNIMESPPPSISISYLSTSYQYDLDRIKGDCSLRIEGDHVFLNLPYIRITYVDYSEVYKLYSNSLVSDAPITDFKVTDKRRGITAITFSTEHLNYSILVYPNGDSSILIKQSKNSNEYRFRGRLQMPNS